MPRSTSRSNSSPSAADLMLLKAGDPARRGRLTMLGEGLMGGAEPDMGNWLEALALMTTYGKYFSSAELKHIFQNWNLIEADWLIVKDLVRSAMDRQLAPDTPEVQALAYRLMA